MWTLDDGERQVVLGDTMSGVGLVSPPSVGSPELLIDDHSIPRGDGILMGQDFYGAQTVTLDLDVRGDGADSAGDVFSSLREWWRDPKHRSTGGRVTELRSPGGRSAFGRPRRFSPDRDLEKHGAIRVLADFECVSDLWFGGAGSVVLSLVPPLGRGLVAPLVEPLTIQGVAQHASGFTVGGEVPTYPIVEFRGPITNPSLHSGVWDLRIRGSLAYDETLVVDTRPWKRSLHLNGRPVAGMLMPTSTRLRDVTLAPGFHSVQLRGVDATGTASALVSWREAFASF